MQSEDTVLTAPQLSDLIRNASSAADLVPVAEHVQDLVVKSAANTTSVQVIGRMVADAHDSLLIKVATLVRESLGDPPSRLSVLVLGSEGRREQFLATDQDNALLCAGSNITPYCSGFGEKFSSLLTELGVPPCPHLVMLCNPSWQWPQTQWDARLYELVHAADAEAILSLTLLADARCIWGDQALFGQFQDRLLWHIGDNPLILKYMAREALRFPVPIGFFHNLVVEKNGPERGTLDLKKGGIFALTQGIKVLALEQGLRVTGTLDRLHGLNNCGVISETRARALEHSYLTLQKIRLQGQIASFLASGRPDNRIRPADLPKNISDQLKQAFEAIAAFQDSLSARFGLHLLP